MVSRKASKRQTKSITKAEPKHPWAVFDVLITIFAVSLVAIIYLFYDGTKAPDIAAEPEIEQIEPSTEIIEPEELIPVIDFQPTIDQWAKNQKGNKSVIIYDLKLDQIVGEYNPNEDYSTASLYKLFVVYEGYRRLESGEWQNTKLGRTGKTVLECLDLAIRESHSTCAETLWEMIGHDTLDDIIESELDITDSDISKLRSNPKDIAKIIHIFYHHPHLTNETFVAQIKDSMLNQPITTDNWRQGLPSGFSKNVDVYDKVGWEYNPDKKYWNIYHDAAIIDFKNYDRQYIVVVMTNFINYREIRKLGSEIEKTFTAAMADQQAEASNQ
ncbi:serine hydrolase [Candidatus Saccharibacteria bacterium]|nr:serine hydrolase [Candidatus Saccharibacteria bacterium]